MAKSRRKLAAILSADVVGYSRLMEGDDAATVRQLKATREVFAAHIARCRGRLVDATGDALLAEFGSAVDAVECAALVQAELARHGLERPTERRMQCRVGINLGDVLDDGRALFGDGVNVAARLEALAEPGGICLSGKVYDEVAGKLELTFEDLGEQQVKNIRAPLRVYRCLPAPPLQIRLLGEIELGRGPRRLALPQSKKTRALLAYLVVSGRPQRRDRLCGMLWDVADDPRAALRWSLSKLRPLVDEPGCPRLVTQGATVAFDAAGARVDLFALRALLAEDGGAALPTARLEELAAEFRGPFLEGLELPDFLEFQTWCIAVREEARGLHARLLATLVERLAADPAAALPYARALAQVDAFDEAAHAALVRLLVACGRRGEAEQHAQVAARLLREIDGAGAVLDRARREVLPAPALAPAVAPEVVPAAAPATALVGRQQEWIRLRGVLDACIAQRGLRAVLLVGEPGIGKTRLLAELMAAAARCGGTVLDGTAYEAESSRPYGPWIDALRRLPAVAIGDQLGTQLAPLLPELGQAAALPDSRDRLFGAVAELLAARAHSAPPVLLVFDDVHWCDAASAELLHYLARMNRHRPVLLALSARDGELPDNEAILRVLRGLRHDGVLEEIAVAPLSADETAALVRGVVPGGDDDGGRVFAESAGNPLFALEVARSLPHRPDGVPLSLRRLVRDRVERLPADAADVLRWGAVIGHGFDADRLAALAALDEPRLLPALEVLERHALLRAVPAPPPAAARYGFAHDVVRQVVYADLSEPRRRLMHQHIVRVLQAGGEPDEATAADLAHHAALAGDAETAARACLRAAQRCLRLFASAEADALARRGAHYAQALREPERVQILIELAEVRFRALRPRDGAAAAREVEALAKEALAFGCVAHARLGFHVVSLLRWEGGDGSDAQRQTLRAEQISRGGDARERVVALAEAARCLTMLERDLGHAEALALEAAALAARLDVEPAAIADAVGMLRLHQGELDEAAERFAHAREICRREQDRLGEFRALEHLAVLELQRQRYDEARRLGEDLVAIGARLGEGSEAPYARALVALCALAADAAAGAALDAALDALRVADAKQRLGHALLCAAELDLQQGRAAAARARAAEALELATLLERPSDVVLARVALARAAALAGDADAVRSQRTHLADAVRRGVSAHARRAAEALETAPLAARRRGRR